MDTLLYPTLLRDLWPHLDMSHWPTLDRHLYPFYPISLPPSIPVTQHPDPILARRLRLKESGITFEYYKKLFYTPLDNLILITIEFSLDTLLANMPDCDTLAHTPIDRHHPHCIFAILKSAKQHLRRSLRTGKFANKAINQKKYHVLCKFASRGDTAEEIFRDLLEELDGVFLELEGGVREERFFPYRRGGRLEIFFYEPGEPIVGWRSRGLRVWEEGGRG
ncbi:hypothetical protein BDQ94DRAFT_166916 [Aspergillus welwitschiae]|uniref:Uncharacterized protein n=1 Tax=Aspergillus welwitschiae TaxID=1341132 RepID=A0A3F3QDR0_9EURO|nr:hypothetical protein BDQ94DRAFT_166916 [Aspergillus welwitschiae]RDH36816.1 hypothetical protein BDQ94DRAFT_166916 [Aspergillus welwitschiae]